MAEYQVLARKYRPKTFKEVIGQETIVTTLKNGMKSGRLAHAYLFCGSRGTGKTTLARVLAKALNCSQLTAEGEPCNQCRFCREITSGQSLDVLEIDGASHRGIDDIRQINETVTYTSSGKYKIYVIDEVHMLTKEAFNALLKTLEEPPDQVKFFFATTEPHKVPSTILSRCQRFNLNRIPLDKILEKLSQIAADLEVEYEPEALRLIAKRAEGGLRDAESLFDQILSFHEGKVTAASVSDILGIVPQELFFKLDKAGKEGNLAFAFDLVNQVFSEGKNLLYFLEALLEHFRNLLLAKLTNKEGTSEYAVSARLYTEEQCLSIIDMLVEAQNNISRMPSIRVALEAILLRILRSHQRVPIDLLIQRLTSLEEKIRNNGPTSSLKQPTVEKPRPQPMKAESSTAPVSESSQPQPDLSQAIPESIHKQSRVDTLLQFAAVELEGKIEKT